MVKRQNILIVEVDADKYESFAPLLQRKHFDVDRFPGAQGALELVTLVPFAAIIINYPLQQMQLDDFLLQTRAPSSASNASRIALLSSPKALAEAQEYLKKKVQLVLADNEDPEVSEQKLSTFLGIRARASLRIMVKLEVTLENSKKERFMAQSKNISGSGMFVATKRLYPIGSRARFEFILPNDTTPFGGMADVTRQSERGETLQGLGFKFLSFTVNSQENLLRCLGDLIGS